MLVDAVEQSPVVDLDGVVAASQLALEETIAEIVLLKFEEIAELFLEIPDGHVQIELLVQVEGVLGAQQEEVLLLLGTEPGPERAVKPLVHPLLLQIYLR